MSTALQLQQPKELQQWKSPTQIKQRVQAIQQLMNEVLKKDTDYGVIPGMPKGTKPSLWKPGSEQILAMFQIAVDPVVEDLSTEDCYRYRVTTRLTNVLTGEFLGAGIGEASTEETKYKWRRTYSKPEFDAADPDRKRIKYGQYKDQGGNWVNTEEMQVRQAPADLANTVLKISKKRSQIDATLTVTGASSMFEQDLEDLSDETRQAMAEQRRGSKKPEVSVGNVICASCAQTNGHAADCKYFTGKCPDCKAEGGHLPSCRYRKAPTVEAQVTQVASPAPAVTQTITEPEKASQKVAVLVLGVEAKSRKVGAKVQPYLVLSVVNPANEEFPIYVWDTKLHTQLTDAKDRNCLFEITTQTKGDKTYCSLVAILEMMPRAPVPDEDPF